MKKMVKTIADAAEMIINGYAYTQAGNYIRILNLNKPNHAAVIGCMIGAAAVLILTRRKRAGFISKY